jgi:hypothetical protein
MIITNRFGNMVMFGGAFVSHSEKRAAIVSIGDCQLTTSQRAIVALSKRFCLVLKRDGLSFTPHFKLWGNQ